MKNYKDLLEELPSKTAVFTVGRFNPASLGHELLIKVVRKLAKQRKADHFIFVSTVQDAKKNPLEVSKKIQYLELLFPNTKFVPKELQAAISMLQKYKSVVMVAPVETAEDYKRLLKKNKIESVEVITAGSRCPDSDDKLIKLATKGEYQGFKQALPTTVRELDGKRLMNDIRIGLQLEPIKEQINLVKDELREQYFRGEVFNEGDIVESNDMVYRIVKRGSNHLLLQDETGLKISKWIKDVQLTERQFMLDEKQLQEADSTHAAGNVGSANKAAEKAKSDSEKARLMAAHADEKVKLVDTQKREMDNLKMQMQKEDSPVVNKNSKYNIAKSVMSLSDFRKSMAQTKPDSDEQEIAAKVHDGLVGNVHMGDSHGLRHRKVKYHLGEASAAAKLQKAFQREQEKIAAERKAGEELLKKPVKEEVVSEGNGYDDNRTGFAKKPREDDEGHSKPAFKAKSMMDRPHTVHIDGKPWKKFDNGHQAHAAAKTLTAKGKKATAIAHFKEETEEQQGTRAAQLKRFKQQAADAKLGCDIKEAAYAGLEKEDKPGKVKTAAVKAHPKAVAIDTVEGWKDEDIGFKHTKTTAVKEEFDDINEEELINLVEADMDALTEEDFYEAYDDDELAIIDDETGEEIEAVAEEAELDAPALMEVLSRQERIRARARMRRSQTKRERREKVAVRQLSTPAVANRRARRMAVSALKKRLLRGQNPATASVGQKERVERFIQQRRKIVDRLAARMVSRVKQVEKARMSHKKFTKPNNGVAF